MFMGETSIDSLSRASRRMLSYLLALLALGVPSFVLGEDRAAPDLVAELREVQSRVQEQVEAAIKGTVAIEMGNGMGSGVVISKEGLVLTAAHVFMLSNREVTIVLADGSRVPGRTLGRDTRHDAGMIQILAEGPFEFVPVVPKGDSPKLADWCFATGHPGGQDKERGAVLRVGRILRNDPHLLQTDCELIGGDSGGPLFDLEGRVIGIHTSISPDADDNFHVPLGTYHENWAALAAGESIKPQMLKRGGFVGIRSIWRDDGQFILEVNPKSPAGRAGLRNGDVIRSVDGNALQTARGFQRLLRDTEPGEIIRLELAREDSVFEQPLRLGSWPARRRPLGPPSSAPQRP